MEYKYTKIPSTISIFDETGKSYISITDTKIKHLDHNQVKYLRTYMLTLEYSNGTIRRIKDLKSITEAHKELVNARKIAPQYVY